MSFRCKDRPSHSHRWRLFQTTRPSSWLCRQGHREMISGKFWMPCTRPAVQFFNMEKSTAHQPVTKLTADSQRPGRPQYPLPSSTMLSQVARPTKSSNLRIDEALYYLSDPVSCYLNILNQSSRLLTFSDTERMKRLRIARCYLDLPSGNLLHSYGKSPFFMGKSTISVAIFNSKLLVYRGW